MLFANIILAKLQKRLWLRISIFINTSGPPRWLSGNESACIEEDSEDDGLIPGFEDPLDEKWQPLQYSWSKRVGCNYLQSTFYFGMCKANAYFNVYFTY